MNQVMLKVKITAQLKNDPDFALPKFAHHGREIGFHVTEQPAHVIVHLIGGDLHVQADQGATRLTIAAPDPVMLQMLRDYVTHQLSLHALSPAWEGHRAEGQPDSHARCRVKSSVRLSPSYYRVTVVGTDLMRFDEGGLHFRVLTQPEGLTWPVADANGVTQWPGGISAWHRPVYTTRALRKCAHEAELDFDVVIHEGGRMTGWASRVQPDTEVVLVGPAGNRVAIPAGWQGFVGDETAVPGIIGQVSAMSEQARGQAVLVVPTAADIQDFDHPAGVEIVWALRDQGQNPLSALEYLEIPDHDRSVFFVGNGKEAREARELLLQRGLSKKECVTVAYWGKEKH